MAQRPAPDRYANILDISLTQSGVNTLTFIEVLTGISLGRGQGIIIDMIEYLINPGTYQEMTADGDSIWIGWSVSDAITTITGQDQRILHRHVETSQLRGAAANMTFLNCTKMYTFFPPIVIAAPRIFFFANSFGFANAGVFSSRMYLRYIDLTPQDYLELAETFVLTS